MKLRTKEVRSQERRALACVPGNGSLCRNSGLSHTDTEETSELFILKQGHRFSLKNASSTELLPAIKCLQNANFERQFLGLPRLG